MTNNNSKSKNAVSKTSKNSDNTITEDISAEHNSNIKDSIDQIEKDFEKLDAPLEYEDGVVVSVIDDVISAYGLKNAFIEEKVKIISSKDITMEVGLGMIMNLEENKVGIVLIRGSANEGDQVIRTEERLKIKVGAQILGRVLNGLGEPIDELGEIGGETEEVLVEKPATGIIERKSVQEPLYTGIKVIDTLIPIGRGQRELIIGDKQTGKSAIAVDTILNQKNNKDGSVYCIYVFIGQRQDEATRLYAKLKAQGAMKYSVIVSASASDSSMIQYLAPYVGTAIGEYFMNKGQHALIIYDDLSKHAIAYREISLLLKRPPSREAYPGDIFYIHSKLLERSAKLSDEHGGGSLTALPIVETKAGDVSGYIPTNVISITDGQIFLDVDLYNRNIKPAINIGLSVSRIGSSAQTPIVKQLIGMLKIKLASYNEMAEFSQFGSDLDPATQELLNNGKKIIHTVCQKEGNPIKIEYQIILIFMAINKYLDQLSEQQISEIENYIIKYFEYETNHPEFFKTMLKGLKLSNNELEELHQFNKKLVQEFLNQA